MINLQVRYFSKYMSKFEYYMWYSLEKNIDRFLFLSIFILLYHTSNQSRVHHVMYLNFGIYFQYCKQCLQIFHGRMTTLM